MNKKINKTLIIISIIVVVLIGAGFYIASQNSQAEQAKMVQEKDAMMQKDAGSEQKAMDGKEDGTMDKSASSRYIEYSKAVFDQAVEKRRVLFFYANWCPICKPADADFTANASKIPADVTLIRVNYNDTDTDQEEKDLAKQYGITYQHTFVQIDAQGKVVTKWNGGQTNELLANIK